MDTPTPLMLMLSYDLLKENMSQTNVGEKMKISNEKYIVQIDFIAKLRSNWITRGQKNGNWLIFVCKWEIIEII